MSNFANVSDIENVLQISISDPDQIASAEFALTLASAAVRIYTRQYIELVNDETITRDSTGRGSRIYLPELPVVSVSQVIEDGDTLIADTDFKLGEWGILHRLSNGKQVSSVRWAKGIQVISITYSHGYSTIPDAIIGVTARAASRAYQAGLKSAEDEGVPGIASKSLGDYSVSYATPSGGEGIMGVSASRMLLLSEKDILDHYRIKPPK